MSQTGRMNQIDFTFFALGQSGLVSLHFNTCVDAQRMRQACRGLLNIYPRLRALVEPTLLSYRFRILDPQDARLETLFQDSFRLIENLEYGSEAYRKHRRALYNEAFAPEFSLPVRFHYLPGKNTSTLLFLVNHMVLDGMSAWHMFNSLMAILNGQHPAPLALDSPSLLPALLEDRPSRLPDQLLRSLARHFRNARRLRQEKIIPLTARPATFLGPSDIHQHTLGPDIATLNARAKQFGCSITVLLLAALGMTAARGPGRDAGDVIGIPMQVDLRPFFPGNPPVFGNYLIAPMIRIPRPLWDEPRAMIEEIARQLAGHLSAVAHKDIALPVLLEGLGNFIIGRKRFSRVLGRVKSRGVNTKTCFFSNMGNADTLNTHGDTVRVREILTTTKSDGLLFIFNSLGGLITVAFTYPEAEYTPEEIHALVDAYEASLATLLEL